MLLIALMLAAAPLVQTDTAPNAAIDVEYNVQALAVPGLRLSDELDLASLDDLRGGDGSNAVIITEQTLKAVNTGNSITGASIVSGDVSLGTGAFSGYNGIGNFAINTGNNNNLQSSVSVSIIMAPAAP